MDSNKLNMIVGGLIGSLLVFLLLNFFTGKIYGTGEHGGHEALAFAVAVEDTGPKPEKQAVDPVTLVATADLGKGEKIFNKCKACHSLTEGEDKTGPSLYRVVGRPVGTEPGFGYSDAMKAHGGNWTLDQMFHFLASPKAYVPGTKMGFAGLSDPQDRVDIIAYLNQAGGAPIDLTQAQ